MSDAITTIESLKEIVRDFAGARHWAVYHTLKNLSMALACEASELMEHFLWLTGEESQQTILDPLKREAIADELADVACLVFQFSNHSGIDLSAVVHAKMKKNEVKYPV